MDTHSDGKKIWKQRELEPDVIENLIGTQTQNGIEEMRVRFGLPSFMGTFVYRGLKRGLALRERECWFVCGNDFHLSLIHI